MSQRCLNEASIRQMVDVFYARVRDDAILAPVFDRTLAGKWDEHMPRMYAFWNRVLLGTGSFQGNVFGTHMALDGIEKDHFDRWLELFRATVREIQTEADAAMIMAVAERIAESLQLGYSQQASQRA